MLTKNPRLAMTGVPVLSACWNVLTIGVYRLGEEEARQLCIRCPSLLSRSLLRNGVDRLRFFTEELGLYLPNPDTDTDTDTTESGEARKRVRAELVVSRTDRKREKEKAAAATALQKMVVRFPALLHIDANVFLRPNTQLLQDYLDLSRDSQNSQNSQNSQKSQRRDSEGRGGASTATPHPVAKLLGVFPQLLGHNPLTLEKHVRAALLLLTGRPEYVEALCVSVLLYCIIILLLLVHAMLSLIYMFTNTVELLYML